MIGCVEYKILEDETMTGVLLSIIVPVYKVEAYLKKCVDVLLNQPLLNCEIILVNDGSPDACGQICDKYACMDKRVRVIHKQNGGLSSARNAGLNIACGKYITFVDSDDVISPDSYLENVRFMEEHGDIDILEYPTYWNYGTKEAYFQNLGPLTFSGTEDIFSHWWRGNPITPAVWNKIYKSEIFKSIRFPEGHVFEDLFLIVDFSEVAKKVYLSTKGTYFYYVRENSISRSSYSIEKHLDHFIAQFKSYRKLYDYQSLKKYRLVAFMRVFRRLITAKIEHEESNIFLYLKELYLYVPTWKDCRISEVDNKEKLRFALLKFIGLSRYLNLFIYYKKRKKV